MSAPPILTILTGKENPRLIAPAKQQTKPPHKLAWWVNKISLTIKVKK
jgi:hypothetical protein